MGLKAALRESLTQLLRKQGYDVVEQRMLYDWQREYRSEDAFDAASSLPDGAREYLKPDHPRLVELTERYGRCDPRVTTALVWQEGYVRPEDVLYFRGDNAYVWQLRGRDMNPLAYALTTYYVKSIDTLGLFGSLDEDASFGNFTVPMGGRSVSRDLLDSIMEIHFLERQLGASARDDLQVMDIGAGYGRFAHRLATALPNVSRMLCTDAFPTSTFVSEYYIRHRGLDDRVHVTPLDEIEAALSERTVDVATNIHSFSECRVDAIAWWVELLARHRVRWFFLVPNAGDHQGAELVNNERDDFGAILASNGYRHVHVEPKYADPVVQEHAVNATHYHLFELEGAGS